MWLVNPSSNLTFDLHNVGGKDKGVNVMTTSSQLLICVIRPKASKLKKIFVFPRYRQQVT